MHASLGSEGHQDDEKAAEDLDQWARLNIEMDSLAKQHIAIAKQRPWNFLIKQEPWSIWLGDIKLVKNLHSNLYNFVHSEEAESYWTAKQRITPAQVSSINWEAIKGTMSQEKRRRRVYISKHAVGICGVGKFLLRWKESQTTACPRCGALADEPHVWICPDHVAEQLWNRSLDNLREWLQ